MSQGLKALPVNKVYFVFFCEIEHKNFWQKALNDHVNEIWKVCKKVHFYY